MGCLLLLSACASGPERAPWPHVELTSVPFHPQEAFQCGPAALAAILGARGLSVEPHDLLAQVYLPGRRGSLQIELVAAVRRQGLVPYALMSPTRAELHRELAAGNPVLVLQNLGLAWYPRWHYAVLVGLDRGGEEVILRSGREPRRVLSWKAFARTWDRAQRWALVVMPPDRPPATAQETAYLRAIAAFEQLRRWDVTRPAYQAALTRWPHSLGGYIGLGNTLYATGDIAGAADVLRAAARAHPGAAVAFNNLAFVLARQGDLAAAEAAAKRAVELGEGQGQYRQTLEEIRVLACVSGSCRDASPRK